MDESLSDDVEVLRKDRGDGVGSCNKYKQVAGKRLMVR